MTTPTTRQSNPKRTVVAINAAGGPLVLISASKFAKYVEITECPPTGTSDTYAPQGLILTLPDDGYVTQYGLPPGLIWSIGDNSWRSKAGVAAPAMTDPAGNSIPATAYAKLVSATSTATNVQVTEWS
jgi:hypothetical protein